MSKFFINRPIVAMVIAILMVIIGAVAITSLPVALFPEIAPPEVQVVATYVGADAQTIEQSVATPVEQQMSGVDNMNYMYSLNSTADGVMRLIVDYDVKTDPNTDLILTQIRETQAASQLPADVTNYGITVQKTVTAPLMLVSLYSPNGTYDAKFLANYAYINLADQITRSYGIGSVQIFGAGQYAMRLWVKPDQLAKLAITVPEIVAAIESQNAVNPAGQVGSEPVPKGQEYTYTVRAQGRLTSPEEFGEIVVRESTGGAVVRVKDVARVELGAQNYSIVGRLNGKPCAIIAAYQLPGSNAVEAANGINKLMADAKTRLPNDIDYVISLDTTKAVTQGIKEIVLTLGIAIVLVIIVVYIFLQGWRATLIPLLAVPVSLVGTFIFFPLFGFSVNTLSLFGLVLAIGLVVDDAIVVVEAVERHIEEGLTPKAAALKAMEEISGPVVGIALVLSAVFIPTAFIPGITGRLYQQFAVTIAISVALSAFNALTLSPALSALLGDATDRAVTPSGVAPQAPAVDQASPQGRTATAPPVAPVTGGIATVPAPAGPVASPPTVGGSTGALVNAQITGTLKSVSVDTGRFVIREEAKTHEIQVGPDTLIYAGNEQISFKRMAAYVGTHLTVWVTTDESPQLANRVILTVVPAPGGAARTAGGTTAATTDRPTGGTDLHGGGSSGGGHTAHH